MLWQGMLLGLSLSFLVGPLLFAIVEASLERGFRAGLALASGVWVSDLLYMLIVYRWVDALMRVTALPHFRLWAGLAGSVVLVVFGGITLMKKSAPTAPLQPTAADRLLDVLDGPEPPGVEHNWTRWGYPGYVLRGFLLNTVNPFTVFFWLGLASAFVVSNQLSPKEVLTFFGGMLGVLVGTDTLKAYAAKRVRLLLQVRHLQRLQQGLGMALLLSGLVLLVRVFMS